MERKQFPKKSMNFGKWYVMNAGTGLCGKRAGDGSMHFWWMEKKTLGLRKLSVRNAGKNLWSEKAFLEAGHMTKKTAE